MGEDSTTEDMDPSDLTALDHSDPLVLDPSVPLLPDHSEAPIPLHSLDSDHSMDPTIAILDPSDHTTDIPSTLDLSEVIPMDPSEDISPSDPDSMRRDLLDVLVLMEKEEDLADTPEDTPELETKIFTSQLYYSNS